MIISLTVNWIDQAEEYGNLIVHHHAQDFSSFPWRMRGCGLFGLFQHKSPFIFDDGCRSSTSLGWCDHGVFPYWQHHDRAQISARKQTVENAGCWRPFRRRNSNLIDGEHAVHRKYSIDFLATCTCSMKPDSWWICNSLLCWSCFPKISHAASMLPDATHGSLALKAYQQNLYLKYYY